MRVIFECLFDGIYLFSIFICSWITMVQGAGRPGYVIVSIMALVLGIGDGFHLLPRMKGLISGQINKRASGIGKLVTSITSVIYYLLLYYAWFEMLPENKNQTITILVWFLVTSRISLCLMPQNHWFTEPEGGAFHLLRNLPFVLLGMLLIGVFYRTWYLTGAGILIRVPIAMLLSFAFYIPVVLFSSKRPAIGMLMMPKTLMYMWIHVIFLQLL